jgi:hypothetical protein
MWVYKKRVERERNADIIKNKERGKNKKKGEGKTLEGKVRKNEWMGAKKEKNQRIICNTFGVLDEQTWKD